ncbi:c-type cytochrome [Dyella lutea]|uniref:Cytochrome c domain-containing protein n=1 Tax=Dyella lutea TaxID=2950441 RepID=A0ABT1FBH3_9GAMM|nr:c-type cytochrome [Dyella lutea]MCP1374726.1 hypothetical protein [Dyella lutea]
MPSRPLAMPRVGAVLLAVLACGATGASTAGSLRSIADWAYPRASSPDPGASPTGPASHRPDEIVRVSDSARTYRYKDLFGPDSGAADWFPHAHPPLPAIVAHGTVPGAESCGGCHVPDGTGVPATAALAGLPRDYMLEQIAAFRGGHRGRQQPNSAQMMAKEVDVINDGDIAQALDYFSHLTFRSNVHVVESASVPGTHWHDYALHADADGRREPIGQRIIEIPVKPDDYDKEDTHGGFIAYVPPGSIKRGALLATVGSGPLLPCDSCHGDRLQGRGTAPPLAGRSPTYIARQLLLFASGQRDSPNAAPMQHEARQLTLQDAVAAAAYAASLTGNPH